MTIRLAHASHINGVRLFVDARMAAKTGIGTYIVKHLQGLSRLGAAITATVASTSDEALLSRVAPAVRVCRVSAGIYGLSERFRWGAIPVKRVGVQDVYWFPQYNAPWSLPKPSVISVHDLIQFRYNLSTAQRTRAFVARRVILRAVSAAAYVTCPSKATRNDLLEFCANHGLDPEALSRKIVPILNGVSDEWASPSGEAIERVSQLTGGPFLLTVGNGKPHKNIQLALKLADRIAEAGRPHKLVIVGEQDAHLRQQLRAVGKSTRVIAPGHVSDDVLAALYSRAAATLTPSLYEGFGLPPLEAMMAGCPVLSSNRGGLVEAVGTAGILLDPMDLEAWYRALVEVIDQPSRRQALITAGREWARRNTWRAATAGLADLLAASIGKCAPPPVSREIPSLDRTPLFRVS